MKRMILSKLTLIKYRNWPIFLKMAVVFSLMSTSLVLSIGAVSYAVYRNSMETQIGDFVPQVLSQANKQVESYIGDLTTAWPDPLLQALREINLGEGKPSLKTTLELREMLERLKLRLKDRLYGVTFYTAQGHAFVMEQNGGVWKEMSYETQSWFARLDTVQFTPLVLGTVLQPIANNRQGTFFFSIVQPLRLPGTKELAGAIQIFGTMEPLKTIMRGIDFGPNSRLYIVDHEDKIVYSSLSAQIGESWKPDLGIDLTEQPSGAHSQIIRLEGKKRLLSYNWSSETGWKVVGLVPMENFSKGVARVALWTGVGILIGVLVAVTLSSLLSYGFTGRLQKLSRQIRSVQLDDLELKQESMQYDEIGYLSVSFRSMINRIRNLIEEVLKTKILRQEAEIRALHSQINPHFLYNVLEAIRMTVNKGDNTSAEAALVSLGHVFRYQVDQANDLVPIGKELEFVEQYLRIQALRFGDLLEVQIDADDDVGEVLVPRMAIQPLVENALKHGQSSVDLTIQLTVRIRLIRGDLHVEVIDEGDGMTDRRLAEVIAGLEEGFTSDRRFGLANVYQRIKHRYGDRGSLTIETEEGAGTIVQIRVPAENDGET